MFKTIVVPLDGSPLAEQALPLAMSLANTYEGEIHLVQVVTNYLVPPYGLDYQVGETFRDVALREAHEYLERVQRQLESETQRPIHTKVIEGLVADNILDFANFQNADVIVMATHGRSGVGRWVFGSIAERVLRASDCPVLLVRVSDEEEQSSEKSESSPD
jgi:nucleotide-binding universal stress UspA family protein